MLAAAHPGSLLPDGYGACAISARLISGCRAARRAASDSREPPAIELGYRVIRG